MNTPSFLKALPVKPKPAVLATLLLAAIPPALADEQRLQELERRIQELEGRLAAQLQAASKASEQGQALSQATAGAAAEPTGKAVQQQDPVVAAAPTAKPRPELKSGEDGGYSIINSENGNELRFSAMVQLDSRFFVSGATATGAALDDGFLLRRIRPTWSGKFAGIGFRIVPELSGNGTGANISLLDAFADVPVGDSGFLRIGKQKTAVSIDRIRVATALPLIERGLANELAPNRDLGLSWNSSHADGKVSLVAGLFNGAADGRDVSARDDAGKEIQGRIFAEPFKEDDSIFKGLGFGISATYGSKKNSQGNSTNVANTLPRYRTAAQEEFFSYVNGVAPSGTHARLFPQLAWYYQNLGVVGEYGLSEQELTRNGIVQSLRNTGYDLTFSWVPTGQSINFRGVQLGKYPGGGALELAFRVSGLKIDPLAFAGNAANRFADPDASASRADNYGIGANWHINRNMKWSLDFNSTRFTGGARNGQDREEEQVAMGRLQLVF